MARQKTSNVRQVERNVSLRRCIDSEAYASESMQRHNEMFTSTRLDHISDTVVKLQPPPDCIMHSDGFKVPTSIPRRVRGVRRRMTLNSKQTIDSRTESRRRHSVHHHVRPQILMDSLPDLIPSLCSSDEGDFHQHPNSLAASSKSSVCSQDEEQQQQHFKHDGPLQQCYLDAKNQMVSELY